MPRWARSASRAAGGYAAIGTVTNLAARLCAEAGAGQVLVDRKTLARIDDQAQVQPLGPLVLKGFAQPVPAFLVTGLAQGAAPAPD